MKSYTTVAKRYWMTWSVQNKREGNCKSVYLQEKVNILCIQWNTHLSKREDGGFNSLFSTVKATIPARIICHQVHQEKKMNAIFVMHWVKINLGSSLFSFYQGMVRTIKMSFLQKKNIIWDQCHFASSAESLTQTSIFLPRTDCGLIEGKLNTDNIIRSISFNDITNLKKFLF